MTTSEVRAHYLEHCKSCGHAVVPSSPIIPQNDPTTLFTGSGMQPMIPYLLGQKHPMGNRIADAQICFRADDVEEVGDNRHTTFFEMLGNWSLGDYFKEFQIPMMFDFLVYKLRLDPKRLYFSAFAGSESLGIPRDTISAEFWESKFSEIDIKCKDYRGDPTATDIDELIRDNYKVFYYPEKKNWWSRVGIPENMPNGEPGGPDTEMFYDFDYDGKLNAHQLSQWADLPCHVNCDCGRFIEIGNNVFMEYIKTENGFEKLKQQNVDFGGGLERIVAATIDCCDIFMIDVFEKPKFILENLSGKNYLSEEKITFAMRVILDHLRGATFLCADGVLPASKDQGYFTRRLIRRAVRYARDLGIHSNFCSTVVESYIHTYSEHYNHLLAHKQTILSAVNDEETKFRETLELGIKHFERGEDPFILYSTYGFPFELTLELAEQKGIHLDREEFQKKVSQHQELSRTGSEAKFKGGLADNSTAVIKLHTAHHLLLAALRAELGDNVHQKGSNITGERLRIDFSHSVKMTSDQLERVTKNVQKWIDADLAVNRIEMPREEAEKIGAEMEFGAQYPDIVSVYCIGDDVAHAVSKEFCGGPHVERTGQLGTFSIIKEEASSNGVRRIKATLV